MEHADDEKQVLTAASFLALNGSKVESQDIQGHVKLFKNLLDLERKAEIEENEALLSQYSFKDLERRNLALTKMTIEHVSTGVYGRILLHLTRQAKADDDTASMLRRFSPGDIVGLFQSGYGKEPGQEGAEGVIYRVSNKELVISFNEMHDFENFKQPLSVCLMANQITHERCLRALETLSKNEQAKGSANSSMINVLFERERPNTLELTQLQEQYGDILATPYNQDLNSAQKKAILTCMASQDVSMIHGPPGTGKTTTVVEFILQAVKHQKTKILACAPSNIAVDNIIERLAQAEPKLNIVRIGHPARLLESVQKFCLDALVFKGNEYGSQTASVRKDMNKLQLRLNKTNEKNARKEIYAEFKMLKKDLRQIEHQHINQILSSADVICSTLTSAADKQLSNYARNKLQDGLFDLVVVDECAQAIEPAAWIAINQGKKLVMAGDHCQLDPTVKSNQADKAGLSRSIFERVQSFKVHTNTMLVEQYRMNEAIMDWSSKAMYKGKLQAHDSVKDRSLNDLLKLDEPQDSPLLLVDTAGSLMHESVDTQDGKRGIGQLTESKQNEGEADIVMRILEEYEQIGLQQSHIGIITPYSAQVSLLRKMVRNAGKNYEVATVDGFQGREKEVIIISMVRSNPSKTVGFLANKRRMNVAVTRAKRMCVLICDSGTVGSDKFLKGLVKYFKDNGNSRTAFEFGDTVKIGYGASSSG